MAHPTQFTYVAACANFISDLLPAPDIIEIGSYDVNGSIRSCFPRVNSYTGLDLMAGPGVDVVGSGHEYGVSNTYDIAISCECFEHNPYWLETFINMIRITRPGGVVIFTCATRGRPEHGTARTDEFSNPGGISQGWDYYRNLLRRDFERKIDMSRHFSVYDFYVANHSKDLMFFVVKSGWHDSDQESCRSRSQVLEVISKLRGVVNDINKAKPRVERDFPILGRVNTLMLLIASNLLCDRMYQDLRIKQARLSHYLSRKMRKYRNNA